MNLSTSGKKSVISTDCLPYVSSRERLISSNENDWSCMSGVAMSENCDRVSSSSTSSTSLFTRTEFVPPSAALCWLESLSSLSVHPSSQCQTSCPLFHCFYSLLSRDLLLSVPLCESEAHFCFLAPHYYLAWLFHFVGVWLRSDPAACGFACGQQNLSQGVLRVRHNSNPMSDRQGRRTLTREGRHESVEVKSY